MSNPIIGIVLDYEEKTIKDGGYSDFPWYALRTHYSEAISKNGGVPIFISYEDDKIDDYLKICDGILIPGGEYDIHPSYYGENINPETRISTNHRTEFECELVKKVLAKNIPFIGICAGEQLLNIVLGGTLHQDINKAFDKDIEHKLEPMSPEDRHLIKLEKGSLLYKITGKEEYKVNSHHHQVVNKPGRGLKISARAPDGVIEAIEHEEQDFCIGVEWHPEYQRNAQDKQLFVAFIAAARKYSK